jgi:hypothetical protein
MARYRSRIPLAELVLTGTLATAGPTQALDVRCQQGPLVREVEVRFARDADGLPCAVIWRGRVGSDPRQLVWRSDSRLDFCTAKARALAHQLIDGGWACESDMAVHASRSVPAPTARVEPSEPEADAALPLGAAPDPDVHRAPPARREQAGPRPDQALLEAAVARDLERLDELSGSSPGSFEAQMSRLGDLDGDGIADAVALLTYRPKSAPPSLHLLAYLFDGETFRPVARLPLAATSSAEIRDVVDGVIEVLVHPAPAGDPACCPGGLRHLRLVLRDHELVRLPPGQTGTWADLRRLPPAL